MVGVECLQHNQKLSSQVISSSSAFLSTFYEAISLRLELSKLADLVADQSYYNALNEAVSLESR